MKASHDSTTGKQICVCPDGSIPQAGTGFCQAKAGTCSEEQFTCKSNGLCIPKLWTCNIICA